MIPKLRKRFNRKFADKIKKKIGNPEEFRRLKHEFLRWRDSFAPEVISPFIAHYTLPQRSDRADSVRDMTTEFYHGPFSPPPAPSQTPIPPEILEMEDERFRLPPGRHMIPIIYRRPVAIPADMVVNPGPPSLEPDDLILERRIVQNVRHQFTNLPGVPRDQLPDWLQAEEGL